MQQKEKQSQETTLKSYLCLDFPEEILLFSMFFPYF